MLSVGHQYPKKSILISSGPIESKAALLNSVKLASKKGYELYATPGTAKFLKENGVDSTALYWPDDEREPNVLEYIKEGKIDLVINIPKTFDEKELDNDYTIRRSAVDFNLSLITNTRVAQSFLTAICEIDKDDISIKAWDEY